MSTLAKIAILLNFGFVVFVTLLQLESHRSVMYVLAYSLRLSMLLFLGWKTFARSQLWYVIIAVVFFLEASLITAAIFRHTHVNTYTFFRIGSHFVDKPTAIQFYISLPIIGLFSSIFLAIRGSMNKSAADRADFQSV